MECFVSFLFYQPFFFIIVSTRRARHCISDKIAVPETILFSGYKGRRLRKKTNFRQQKLLLKIEIKKFGHMFEMILYII